MAPAFKWLTGVPFAIACFTLPGVIVFQGILWPAFRRTRVIASTGGLRVERRLGLLQRIKEMRAEEIEELALTRVRAPAVTARGGKAAVRFGQGLPEAELEWIRAGASRRSWQERASAACLDRNAASGHNTNCDPMMNEKCLPHSSFDF